jgi:hypothetical protein
VRGPPRAAARRIRPDIDADIALDLLFAPLHYRLLISQEPIDAPAVDTFVGSSPRSRDIIGGDGTCAGLRAVGRYRPVPTPRP